MCLLGSVSTPPHGLGSELQRKFFEDFLVGPVKELIIKWEGLFKNPLLMGHCPGHLKPKD